ncbi:S8 family serine peptidase [Deinococcus maricopensis]|uniref:Peptidase S8 and S53 subtilisin kexin sedolisin n=1 Tax=Deinococcus maricopensis (strain DSM 21211 / LMG 22137 / NRRL B-23946 / LB-34) TaxID=709986 RepID=E8U3R1_DEIML|nr:S8 family serine peptidase [Deinococcus maricopensis]ADV68754.1 peptidase S8 and S53 subtilisin kexin sedolisin [Deinococcus maricopensis DSM 21211]
MPIRLPHIALSALSAALLIGCSQPTSAPTAARYAAVATVQLQPGDTRASLRARLHGDVLSWPDCQPGQADCTATVGLSDTDALTPQGQGTLRALAGTGLGIEPNRDVFSGGGTLTAVLTSVTTWAGGSVKTWSGGSVKTWSGGTYTPLPQNTGLWGTLGLQSAQQQAPKLGAGVTVAVIDTGLDVNHPAFAGALSAPGTWRDFVDGDALPQEEGVLGVGAYGHGTNVAGIVLQVAPQATIMPLRVLAPDGSGDVSSVVQAIDWAVAKGANVINLSLGSDERSKAVQDAINRASTRNVLVVCSAGNQNEQRLTYPAYDAAGIGGERTVSVGSVDAQDRKSSFSNYSDRLEVVAPGENVYAPAPGNAMAAWSGTSMAAPMVSGGLALALAEGSLNPRDLAANIIDKADDIYKLNPSYKGMLGRKGRLDLAAFIDAALH